MKPLTPSILTSHPLVQARSDGECPTPTGCSLAPSLLASSTIDRQCSTVVGANTRCGLQRNVFAQLVNSASGAAVGTDTPSTELRSSLVLIDSRFAGDMVAGLSGLTLYQF
jgi:hypothetical protein